MKLVVLQIKGGVGKTSIAVSFALSKHFALVTNDVVTDLTKLTTLQTYLIDTNLKRIPAKFMKKDLDIIFDMGAMSGLVDAKTAHAVKMADGVLIPTMSDARSIRGAIETIKFVQTEMTNIFIIVNKVTNDKEFEKIVEQFKPYLATNNIFFMRDTTLFKRIADDGDDWYLNMHNKRGNHMLKKTMQKHNEIYEEIIKRTKLFSKQKKGSL
jgi:MinD-like ATPase involved in chromosome partitioning or flagellar assembly